MPIAIRFGAFLTSKPAVGMTRAKTRVKVEVLRSVRRRAAWNLNTQRTISRPINSDRLLGETLKVCFLEAVLRDQRDGSFGSFPMREMELHERIYADIEAAVPLSLVDLRDDCAIRMGVPTDVHRASNQRLARLWSVAFHEHPCAPDGIIYPSRLNGQTNLAIYDRAIPKLRAARLRRLIAAPGLADVLDDLAVEFAPPDP